MRVRVLICKECGSTSVRRSKRQSLLEMPRMLLGIYPFRCLTCSARFWVSVWLLSTLAFAKCPTCLSVEVTTWPEKYFNPGLWGRVARTFGAHHYRCHPCRVNFTSMRPLRPSQAAQVSAANPVVSDDARS